jgi:hypothetical protein
MPLSVTCPRCQIVVAVPDEYQGKALRCPACRAVISCDPMVGLAAIKKGSPGVGGRSSEPPRQASVGLIIAGVVVGLLLLLCAGMAGVGYFVYRGVSRAAAEIEQERAQAEAKTQAARDQEAAPRLGGPDRIPMQILPHIDQNHIDGRVRGDLPAAPPLILPPLPPAIEIKPAPVRKETVFNLPDTVAGVAVGGGGRFLVLHFSKLHKLGVFDVNEAKIAGYVPVDDSSVSFAAGMNKLLVYQPGGGILLRYDLLTRQREKVGKLADPPTQVAAFCMGSASSGPLLISASDRPGGGRLFNIDTFEPLPLSDGDSQALAGGACWASADGRVFAFNGASTAVLEGGRAQPFRGQVNSGYIQPGPDGKHLFTGGYGILTNRIQPAEDVAYSSRDNNSMTDYLFVPAEHGPYYLQLHFKSPLRQMHKQQQQQLKQAGVGLLLPRMPGQPLHADDPEHGITLYVLAQRQPLAQLPAIKVPTSDEMQGLRGIGIERSVHLVPRARLLVVLAGSRDKLLLYPLDVEAALEKSGVNYLLITSQPPAEAQRGQELVYQIAAKAKAGGLNYKLDSGPEGMTVAADGKLTWKLPADFAEKQVDVIVSVRDADGQEKFHTFTLAVR